MKMCEKQIFEILLKNKNHEDYNYDYPKLQEDAVDVAADMFTETIYETLKQKSTASRTKRENILKYLHTTCWVKDLHFNSDGYECYLKILRKSLQSDETNSISNFLKEVNLELKEDVPTHLLSKMINFYSRKNANQKEKIKKLEFIEKMNQEKLDSKVNMNVKENFSHFDITDNVIKDLIRPSKKEIYENRPSVTQEHTNEYREKQIKFCFTLLNLKNTDTYLIEKILQRLTTYKRLEVFEINFLFYLWHFEDEIFNFAPVVSEKFPLVLERFLIRYATKIINLKEDSDVYLFFSNLKHDKKLSKIKGICAENVLLSKSMKSLIYQLYYHSYCNENVLKLINFVE